MTVVAEIVTLARVDLAEFEAKMRRHDQRIDQSVEKSKKAGRGAFTGAAIGGAVGSVAGAAMSTGPMGQITGMFSNLLSVILAPLVIALMPLMKVLIGMVQSPEFKSFMKWAAGGVEGAATTVSRGIGLGFNPGNIKTPRDAVDASLGNAAIVGTIGAFAARMAGLSRLAGFAIGGPVGFATGMAAFGLPLALDEAQRHGINVLPQDPTAASDASQRWLSTDAVSRYHDPDVGIPIRSAQRTQFRIGG